METTCISRQYQVSGWSGFLARDWYGDQDGVLPNASGSSWLFQPFGGVRVWPSSLILVPGFCSSRSLDLVATNTKNSGCELKLQNNSHSRAQRPMQENKNTNGLVVTVSYPWWVRYQFICHQWIPSQMWGQFLSGKKVLTNLLEPPVWQFKGWLWTATAPHCWTRPLGSYHFFLSPPRNARKCDHSPGHWVDWWAHQSHDLSHVY